MPLTRRQFELEIDEEAENWMRQVYELLADHRDVAYSHRELLEAVLGESYRYLPTQIKFDHALNVLTEIGAIDVRTVGNTRYFAFLDEVDTKSWVKKKALAF